MCDANDIKSWWDGSTFDRVLIDAPCSGSGIISHHPDIKLLRKKMIFKSLPNNKYHF